MSNGEVLDEYADQFEFLKYSNKGSVPLNYHREEFEAEERHRVLVSEDHSVLREELLQDQLVDGLSRISVILRVVYLLFTQVLGDVVCEKLQRQESNVG